MIEGPQEWGKWYPVAVNGTRQSPVDIVPGKCNQDKNLPALQFQYTPAWIKVVNTGSSWRMDFKPEGSNLSGGPLDSDYKVFSMLKPEILNLNRRMYMRYYN